MTRPLAVLRPEPGASATAARIAALGLACIKLPLFVVHALPWEAPPPEEHDALLLTSANAIRHGGAGLRRLRSLPVFAVGRATAAAAREAGFDIAATGEGDARALLGLATRAGVRRGLHLAGRERATEPGGPVGRAIAVYASDPRDVPPQVAAMLAGSVALVHSQRAAARLAELVEDRGAVALAAISAAAARAAGAGWRAVAIARAPGDATLIDAARTLAD